MMDQHAVRLRCEVAHREEIVMPSHLTVQTICCLFGLQSEGLHLIHDRKEIARPSSAGTRYVLPRNLRIDEDPSRGSTVVVDVVGQLSAPSSHHHADPIPDVMVMDIRSKLVHAIRRDMCGGGRGIHNDEDEVVLVADDDSTIECKHCGMCIAASQRAIHALSCGRREQPASVAIDVDEVPQPSTSKTVRCKRCREELPESNLPIHNLVCAKERARCPLCLKYFGVDSLEKHIAEEHKKSRCKWCAREFSGNDAAPHELICDERMEPCASCGKLFEQMQMERHMAQCPCRTEMCHWCREVMQFAELQNHVRRFHAQSRGVR